MGAKRAGVVGVDIEPNVSQIGSKVEAAARLLKPLGLRVNLDNDFTREIEAGVGSSRRSLDSINTNKAQSELRQLGAAGDRELGRAESKAKLSSTALLTVGAGAVAVGTSIISSLRPAADAASDLNEAVAYGETVFGESFAAVDKFATGAAEKIGQSRREAIAGQRISRPRQSCRSRRRRSGRVLNRPRHPRFRSGVGPQHFDRRCDPGDQRRPPGRV